jgi:hypothetical protein
LTVGPVAGAPLDRCAQGGTVEPVELERPISAIRLRVSGSERSAAITGAAFARSAAIDADGAVTTVPPALQ